MTTHRKLAAILSADVAGYSRLMADDERATVETLNAYRQLIRERVNRHEGRVVDAPGDALLAEFHSAVEAVDCTAEIQHELDKRNAQLAEHRRMRFRLGINLGDVLEEGGALYGDGVNVAARLQELAEPGGICISGTAFDQVEGKLSLAFKFIGEQHVKNIAKTVRAYRLLKSTQDESRHASGHKRRSVIIISGAIVLAVSIAAGIAWTVQRSSSQQQSADPALAMPTGPIIAVLPFTNMSGDPKEDYFADGITEEIISRLSRFPNLRVLARNSTFQYKGKAVDVRDIGSQLGAAYVVEGSIRRSANTVRVAAQLLDTQTGSHVWAESYERTLDPKNLFAVQDDITAQLATRIGDVHGAVNRADIQKLRTKSTASLDDYECVLLTYEYQRFLTPDKHATVKSCLTQTVERNPDYAEAWANLAYAYVDQYWTEYEGPSNPLQRAGQAARRAVELDPTSQIAHFALANVHFFNKEVDAFLLEAEKALALNPNNTEVVAALGVRFVYAGKRDRGVALIKKAMALNPSHPGWYWFPIVYDHYWNRDYEKSLEAARRVDMPGVWYSHLVLAMNFGQLGHRDHAQSPLRELRTLNPGFESDPNRHLGKWFSKEHAAHVIEGLRKAGLPIRDEKP